MAPYARPVLCRLCGFPAPDGGVPVSEVDREKLYEWCLRVMHTELDQEGLDKAVFCSFCVWQARFVDDNCVQAEKRSLLISWMAQDIPMKVEYGYNYFLDDVIQPCAVSIPVMSNEILQKHNFFQDSGTHQPQKGSGLRPVISNCSFCSAQLKSRRALVKHVEKEHKKLIDTRKLIKCYYMCGAYFENRQLRIEHHKEKHKTKEIFDECIYCEKLYPRRSLLQHIKYLHKLISIKCNFKEKCLTFFHTEEEREKHILEKHESGVDKVTCTYCQKRISRRCMNTHVKEKHKAARIRCNYFQCSTFFLTQEEKQRHILKVHESDDSKYKCIYCKKMFPNGTPYIFSHMKSHKTEAIKCDYLRQCPNYFLTQEEKQKHIREVHESGEDKIWCKFCPRMVGMKCMNSHIKIYHKSESKGEGVQVDEDKCIYCKSQTKKMNLSCHMKQKHKTEAIRCNFNTRCCTYFLTDEDRQKHIDQVHLTEKVVSRVFESCFCKKTYSSASGMEAHIKREHPEAIKCITHGCSKYFPCKQQQEEHFEKMHALEEKGKPFKCTYCKFIAPSRQERDAHKTQVHKNATVRCLKCPKMFKSNTRMIYHVKTVHGTIQECPHCKSHPSFGNWRQHIKRSSCQKCKVTFSCKGMRLRHQKTCARSNKVAKTHIECTFN